jgi:hypothetical protein
VNHFPLLYRLNGQDCYLIWNSNDNDTVETDALGHVLTFKDSQTMAAYAAAKQYALETEEPKLHDLDWVAQWLTTTDIPVNCDDALCAWNLFGDVARSIPQAGESFEQLDRRFGEVYNKLFWGNNLPAMTPEGCHFEPEWSSDEITELAIVLRTGLALFQSSTLAMQEASWK